VFADSELLVRQVNGRYRVKNEGLKPLYLRAMQLLKSFSAYRVEHVRREANADADAMANGAMDARSDVGDAACAPGGSSQGSLF